MAKRKSIKASPSETEGPVATDSATTPPTAPELGSPTGETSAAVALAAEEMPPADRPVPDLTPAKTDAIAASSATAVKSEPAAEQRFDRAPARRERESGWRLVAAPAFLGVAVTFAAVAGAALAPLLTYASAPAAASASPSALAQINDALGRLAADLATLRGTVDAAASDQRGSVAGVVERLDRLEGWESALAAKVARLPDGRDTPAVSREITGAIAAAPKEVSVEGWVVRSAGNGRAIIEGRGNLFQVAPGSQIPGVGLVKDIVQQAGRWTVVTTAGVIVPAPASRAQF